MSCPLHEKITRMLAARGLLKRDLARALGVSPQTATDICKGRSAITLPHLRNLVQLFALRADFWLNDERPEPDAGDHSDGKADGLLREMARLGLMDVDDPAALIERMTRFARQGRDRFLSEFGPVRCDGERRLLGMPAPTRGSVGRIPEHEGRVEA